MRFRLPERRHLASAIHDQRRAAIDTIAIVGGLLLVFGVAQAFDAHALLLNIDHRLDGYSDSLFDEIVLAVLLGFVGLILFGVRRLQEMRREIRARQHAEDRAQHLALADALTGLPNRRQFGNRLLASLGGNAGSFALMMIDLDRFKPVNDVFGHGVGDKVLIAFARRASAIVGTGAMLARFGGDEFALFLPAADTEEPARVARRLLALFERPFDIDDVQVTLGASIGISMAPQDATDPEELLRRADIALYRAKVNGRGNFCFFEPDMDAQVQKRARIERDLRKAIADGTVRPHYQPIVDLKSGLIIGFEALARWDHPEFGQLEPEQFIGIAEDGGLIIPLSAHLLRIAARDATQWPVDAKLCFNISRVQLADPLMVPRILQILGETGLSPTRLEVEISEQVLVGDIVAAKEAFAAFRTAGVRIALDDFGTGNSSLQHLRACNFDRLKIDRSFVMSMAGSEEATSLVNAILGLSKALGLPVTAEGIESEALIEQLYEGGCSEGQGFRFSEAVPQEQAIRLLGQSAVARASA
ncbi:putative bifunctional diguanylate cyclase/phosphodiesterase [Mesorhizobium sp.]|uniref:putative bifunctional diguanylate cyclase/phosphodiesterase n=1 Tax=Mesorhizobium sp. TaxID=1871066 RepID=UPI003BA93602